MREGLQECYVCDKMHDMPLSKRTMIYAIGSDGLPCGNNIDRDRNSAINIMIRFLSQNGLWTTYQLFIDNLRKTGLSVPIAPMEKLVGSPSL